MAASRRPEVVLPDWLVQNRNFVFLWLAYGVAAVGDHLSEMALLKTRGGMDRPDVTRVQALISFGFFLPFVLLGPVAGWWSDRFSRKGTMIAVDLLRAALVWNLATIVPLLARRLEGTGWEDFSIVIPLAVIGGLAAFFSPARQAMLPTLIRDDQLVRANALISALGTIGTIVSAVLGGYLVMHAGPEWNFHINAGTFVLSAVFVGSIAMSRTRAVPHPPLDGVFKPVIAGFLYVVQHRRALQMILLGTVFWAAAGVVISVVPAIVKVFYGEDYAAAGTFRGILGVGLAAGATVMTIIGPTLPLSLAVLIALAAATGWVALLALTYALALGKLMTGLCLFGVGGAGAALLVTIMATLQRFVPDSRRGRVFGVSDTCTMGAMVLASAALGLPHIPNLDRYVPLIVGLTALLLSGTLLVAWRVYRRGDPLPPITRLVVLGIQFYARYWCRAKRDGICTVPRTGPVLLAANHTAAIDPLILIATCSHRLPAFLVAQEHYHAPIFGWFMRLNHCIPLDRARPGKSLLAACLRRLQEGGLLGIFPHGTFVAPGEAAPDAKVGVGWLALKSGATVIPVHISGTTYREQAFGALFVRHRVRVKYGPPVDLSDLEGTGRETSEAATARIMERIAALAE
jgi:1-acyl-sn-glycerol-3-phosphate acyltransferase